MRVMVLIKATANSEAGVMPDQRLMTEMGRFNEQLMDAGVLVGGEGLHPSRRGRRLRISGEKQVEEEGPFAPARELVAGFWIWKVNSMEEAMEWARRCPHPMPGEEAELELRPVFEMEDFGAEFTPELQAQEERLRARVEQGTLPTPTRHA